MPEKRRRFGKIRKLPSGRYQASFVGPSGERQTAPDTFRLRTEAARWLSLVEADLARGTWVDDKLGRETFGHYARGWLRDNANIGPKWRQTCTRNLRLHLVPLEDVPLRGMTPLVVREWHAAALRGTGGRTSIAQSYRFMRAVMNGAVREGAVPRNPCQIPGAGADRAKERPVASPAEVAELVNAITPRYRAAVLLAAWCGLRRGELVGLRIVDVDLDAGTVWVRQNRVELDGGNAFDTDTKTAAGKRTVAVPPHLLPFLREHVSDWAGTARLFVGRTGSPMRGNAVSKAFGRARTKVGMEHFTFHDMRHTGQTLAAATGATLKDLMKRMGHASTVAAYRYMHAVDGRDSEICFSVVRNRRIGHVGKASQDYYREAMTGEVRSRSHALQLKLNSKFQPCRNSARTSHKPRCRITIVQHDNCADLYHGKFSIVNPPAIRSSEFDKVRPNMRTATPDRLHPRTSRKAHSVERNHIASVAGLPALILRGKIFATGVVSNYRKPTSDQQVDHRDHLTTRGARPGESAPLPRESWR